MANTDLFRLYVTEAKAVGIEVSPVLIGLLVLLAVLVLLRWWASRPRLDIVAISLDIGGIGNIELKPSVEDLQIAHRIWTELVTRKAAIPFDPEHDVIHEVHDSWYVLFARIRSLIADIPATQLRSRASTRDLVRIAVAALNGCLRPHLTRWQARYRNWYAQQADLLRTTSPQEVQRQFPDYASVVADMTIVNAKLVQYAAQLQKVVRGQ
jgi:hypothetical protein